MALVTPHTWTAGDDATSGNLQTVTDAVTQLQGGTPAAGTALDFAVLTQTVVQTLTTGVLTALTFDAESADVAGGHSTATGSNTTYTAKNAGWFQVMCAVSFTANATGLRILQINVNGTATLGRSAIPLTGSASTSTDLAVSKFVYLAVGDYVEAVVRQDSGGNLSTASVGSSGTFMHVRWVHS